MEQYSCSCVYCPWVSVSYYVILYSTNEYSPSMSVPLFLTHFTYHDTLHVYPFISKFHDFISPNNCTVFHCVDVPKFFEPLICSRARGLFPDFGYCEQCCNEYIGTDVISTVLFCILGIYTQKWYCRVIWKPNF